jgi:hypothetical protein
MPAPEQLHSRSIWPIRGLQAGQDRRHRHSRASVRSVSLDRQGIAHDPVAFGAAEKSNLVRFDRLFEFFLTFTELFQELIESRVHAGHPETDARIFRRSASIDHLPGISLARNPRPSQRLAMQMVDAPLPVPAVEGRHLQ